MGRIVSSAFAFLLLMAPFAVQAEDRKPLEILRITPSGEDVPATRQIVLEFNRPVVPLGNMARTADEVGITIAPSVNCQWRWLNTTSLSCNLGEKDELVDATQYIVHIEPVIKAEDGATIAGAQDHSFITQRPRVKNTLVKTWTTPGTPVFYVSFNQPVTKASAGAHLFFQDEKTGTRVDVIIDEDKNDEQDPVMIKGVEARYTWVITPKTALPLNSKITLKQEAGIIPSIGDQPSAELRDIQQFITYPEFSLNGVYCYNKNGAEVLITPSSSQSEETLCNPLQPISLSFTAPVLRSQVKDNLLVTPAFTSADAAWGTENRDWSRLSDNRTEPSKDFRINLPYGLHAAKDYTLALATKDLTFWEKVKAFFAGKKIEPVVTLADEFGRTLPPFTLKFATGHRNPNYEMVYRDAVLEKGVDSDVPLYVNNLKDFFFDYLKLDSVSDAAGTTDATKLPIVEDKQFAVPAGIRSILNGKSGAVYAKLKTNPAVDKYENSNRLFAQVTPYQIYAKLGHFQSSVWVTDLATGAVVPDAKVTIYKDAFTNLKAPSDILATGQTDANGLITLPGTNVMDPDLSLNQSYKDEDARLFIRVDKDEDMALLPVSYDYSVQLWDVATGIYDNTVQQYGHMKAWGMTAQGIYRAGDTMDYKIYVRDQDNDRFITPPDTDYTLEISDPTGKSVEKLEKLKLTKFGTLAGQYKIPTNASVGFYGFKLSTNVMVNGKSVVKEFYPLSVLVSDFTPAPFRVTTELNGDAFKAGDRLDIMADAKLHSGGAYGGANVRGTITLTSKPFTSKDPNAKDYWFNSFEGEQDSEDLFQKEDKLDDKGEWKTSFTLPEKSIVFGQLTVESAVRDERGKSIASDARADYAGVDQMVGLKSTEWVYTAKQPAVMKTIVVDTKGKPVTGTPIALTIEKEEVVTAKVKGVGNAYLNDNTVEWKKVADCSVTSAAEGQDCAFTPDSAGTYRVTAAIKDSKGRAHSSNQIIWVGGDDYVQWNEGREYALTILPEKPDYKVGETARYLVKNPYPGVNALITVERYGVIDSFVQTLEGSAPVIEIPVKENYVPGFYVSIVAMSPRVDTPPPEMGQIDMGKPAFRVGYVQTNVSDLYKEITVTAKAEQEVYRPRDIVKVTLNAVPANAPVQKEPMELAVAVLDESVFDLISDGKNAFDPYYGFYDLDSLDVSNYSLLTRLVGRQKFEKKGANPGGDGGVDAGMRNLFKFVSYWNPSVPVDATGNAQIEFEAPDNLTGWRILALAVTPNDRMGLGEANFKVNRPTEIRPVMPNQVREGDTFEAGFSVMNRTDKERIVKVNMETVGDIKGGTVVGEETLVLEPYKRATVFIPLNANLLGGDVTQGTIKLNVVAGDATDTDALEHTLPILKSRTIETAANYGTTTETVVTENIAVPKDIYTDTGDIGVTLSPSVMAGLDGAFTYMRDYPYPCWEQKLTTAVMASNYTSLKPYLDAKTIWEKADTLPQEILDMASSYQATNGGMTYFVAKDEYVDPYLSAYTALAFQWLKQSGYKVPVDVDANLQKYLLAFLRNESAPDYYQDGMTSTVRAVILAAYKESGKITKDDILRFRPHVKNMSLFGKAHYLQAAQAFGLNDAADEAMNMILASAVESGGKFSFNETYDDGYERILATPIRDNCAVLNVLLEDKAFKLVRMITQGRGSRDHFENTQENVFCMNALSNFARKYESTAPDMKVTASYNDASIGTARFKAIKDKPAILARALQDGDAGTKSTVTINREGDGRLYYATRLRYAAKDPKDLVNAGIDVRREYSLLKDGKWTIAPTETKIKRGDLVKVDLYVSIPTARSFVVVNDPLPGGLETVNRDLATASSVDAAQALFDEAGGSYWFKFSDWNEFNVSRWSFYHKELRNDSARFYADWLEPGNYHLSYMAQAVATGTFSSPATKAEEMYDPDVYGLGVKGQLIVEEMP